MIGPFLEQFLSSVLCFALVITTAGINVSGQQSSDQASADAGETAPQTPEELQALVAPIALYPDALVAQILGASTFPDQVAVANYWLQQHKTLTGKALMQEVNGQSWDPSVKALTQFPSVLNNMASNLSWTSSLGEAYHNQQSDVMAAVQTLRHQAQAAGKLKSGSQITVVQQSPQTIVIEPANPQVVYVPQYDPATIYGTPYVTPGYTAGEVAASGIIGFGAGVAVGELMGGGGCCGWGWNAWGCNWHGGAVVYNHNNFYGNAAWHGGYYNGGYHPYNNAYTRNAANNYRNNGNTYNRNVNRNTANFNRTGAQADDRFSGSNSLAQHNNLGSHSSAFSGLSNHSAGSFGDNGGWASRAESDRGWGSMRASGFGGGRFGGGRFGGGGFHGGGFRR
jgi:uncharacterized membrane protein YgcG